MNIDKIKNTLGVLNFEHIGNLNKQQLENQLKALKSDIQNFSSQYCTKTAQKRTAELWLIEYRLQEYASKTHLKYQTPCQKIIY